MLDIKIKAGRQIENFRFPESFGELSFEQFVIYHKMLQGEIETGEMLWFLLEGNEKFKTKIPGSRIADLENLMMWIYSEPAPDWYLKYLKIEDTELIGPAAEFSNVLCGEFAFADTYFTAFKRSVASTPVELVASTPLSDQNNVEKYINKCLAVLMRERDADADEKKADWRGDNRIIFNENHIDRRAAVIAEMPIEMRLAAMFNYELIREQLEKRYKWIFQKRSNDDSGKHSGWDKVMRSMCFGDITKLEDIFMIPLYIFFDELNDTIKENSK